MTSNWIRGGKWLKSSEEVADGGRCVDQLSQVAASFCSFQAFTTVETFSVCVWLEKARLIMSAATGRLSDQIVLSCQLRLTYTVFMGKEWHPVCFTLILIYSDGTTCGGNVALFLLPWKACFTFFHCIRQHGEVIKSCRLNPCSHLHLCNHGIKWTNSNTLYDGGW